MKPEEFVKHVSNKEIAFEIMYSKLNTFNALKEIGEFAIKKECHWIARDIMNENKDNFKTIELLMQKFKIGFIDKMPHISNNRNYELRSIHDYEGI